MIWLNFSLVPVYGQGFKHVKFNKKVNTTNLSSSILMYSFLNCYQCIMYIYTHIQCARIKTKIGVRGSFFFSWGRVGSVRGLFWGILLCEFNQIKFSRPLDPRICIHLQTTSKVCNCASSTCNNYCAKNVHLHVFAWRCDIII